MNTFCEPHDPFDNAVTEFVATSRLDRLRGRLAEQGRDDLDVTWFRHDTPVGELLVAAHGQRLVRVAFAREDFDAVQEQLATRFGARTLRSDRGLEFVRDQLEEYFTSKRHTFEVPVDFALSRGEFRLAVQEHLPAIRFGTTVTYAQLAADAGRPAAVRAAASACATNPLPIVVPCHRVVRSDGTIGAYLGGTESKTWLLQHEGAVAHA